MLEVEPKFAPNSRRRDGTCVKKTSTKKCLPAAVTIIQSCFAVVLMIDCDWCHVVSTRKIGLVIEIIFREHVYFFIYFLESTSYETGDLHKMTGILHIL